MFFTEKKFDNWLYFDNIRTKFIIYYCPSMICYSIKKEGETSEKLILRYKKAFFQTRTANRLKNAQTHSRDLSKRKLREKAIIREYYRALSK